MFPSFIPIKNKPFTTVCVLCHGDYFPYSGWPTSWQFLKKELVSACFHVAWGDGSGSSFPTSTCPDLNFEVVYLWGGPELYQRWSRPLGLEWHTVRPNDVPQTLGNSYSTKNLETWGTHGHSRDGYRHQHWRDSCREQTYQSTVSVSMALIRISEGLACSVGSYDS